MFITLDVDGLDNFFYRGSKVERNYSIAWKNPMPISYVVQKYNYYSR